MYRATIFYRLAVLAVIFGGSTLFVRYGFLPVVREVSGQSTSFEFSVGVNISLILNVSLMAAFGLSEAGRRKANKELRESRQTEEGG